MLELVIGLVAIFIGYFIWLRLQKYKLRDSLGIPGPESQNFFFGDLPNLHRIASSEEERHLAFSRWLDKYGSVFGWHLGPNLEVVVGDLDMLKEILIKNFSSFEDRIHFVGQKNAIMSNGLINITGKHWKRVRSAITPTFSSSKMRLMSTAIEEKTSILMKKFADRAGQNETFDIYQDWQALTLDVIARVAFGFDSKCQTDESDAFLVNCKSLMAAIDPEKSYFIMAAFALPELDWLISCLRPFSQFGRTEKKLIDDLRDVMALRRSSKDTGSSDILQLLLNQSKTEVDTTTGTIGEGEDKIMPISDNEIIANSLTFLIAGYETTSTALAYTAWLLATHPQVQIKLQKEIDEHVTKATLNYDLVHKLPYLDAVFHESLRICPPVINFLSRQCVKACEINGYKFVPGVQVVAPVYAIHHDPEIWPEPDIFDPERFMGERDHHPMSWLPFGAGPRNCIGTRFADMEYKMALVDTLRHFNILLGPDSPKELPRKQAGPLLRPHKGVLVKMTVR